MPRKTPKKKSQQREKQQQEQQAQQVQPQTPGPTKRLETINERVVTVFEAPSCPPQPRSPRTLEAIVVITILLFLIGAWAWATPETSATVWPTLKVVLVGMVYFTVTLPFALMGMAYRLLSGQWAFLDGAVMLWGLLVVICYCGARSILKRELSLLGYYEEDDLSEDSDEDVTPIRIMPLGLEPDTL